MEKLMYDRLTILLKKYNILKEAQNGFREKNLPMLQFIPSLREYKEHWILGYRKLAYFLT